MTTPSGAKKPQDRKAKAKAAPKPNDDGIITITVRGGTLQVPAEALDDFELLDDLRALDEDRNVVVMPKVLRRLVGDQWREAMDLARDPNTGRVTIEQGALLIKEVMGELRPNS